MTPEAFIAIGAGVAMVKAKTIMGAVRLMVHGRTFATVGWPEAGWAVVKLGPEDQTELIALSDALTREPGLRGRRGVTLVHLRAISEPIAGRVLLAAWRQATASPARAAKAG